jgi:hypothetical protein
MMTRLGRYFRCIWAAFSELDSNLGVRSPSATPWPDQPFSTRPGEGETHAAAGGDGGRRLRLAAALTYRYERHYFQAVEDMIYYLESGNPS